MRTVLTILTTLAVAAVPAQGQMCKKAPPPFLADLFPESVSGLPLEFATAPGEGCMAMYRPSDPSARQSGPWATVSMDVEPDYGVGESAKDLQAHLLGAGAQVFMVHDWPIGFTERSIGDEYLTVRGSVRIKILVKNGDHGEHSRALAITFFDQILPQVPCG